jgi:hypothetical protein
MLRGSGDGLVDHLLWHGRVEELVAQVLQQAQRSRGHAESAPATAGSVKHRPDQRQAGALAGEPADDLGAPAGLAEGPFDEVGVADPVPVLGLNVRLRWLMAGCSVLRVRSSARCPRGQFPLCGPQHRRGPIGVA